MSRGLNNNNPGNLRCGSFTYCGEIPQSTDISFRQFYTIQWGYRALFICLRYYLLILKLDTIEKIIYEYAPQNENNTGVYITKVCQSVGKCKDDIITWNDKDTIVKIVEAISYVENGVEAVHTDVIIGYSFVELKQYKE